MSTGDYRMTAPLTHDTHVVMFQDTISDAPQQVCFAAVHLVKRLVLITTSQIRFQRDMGDYNSRRDTSSRLLQIDHPQRGGADVQRGTAHARRPQDTRYQGRKCQTPE